MHRPEVVIHAWDGLSAAKPIAVPGNDVCHDPSSTRDISAGHSRANPRPWLSQSSGLLRVALVQSRRGHECRRLAGRNAGALFMSEDGLHRLRPDWSRRAAGLVAAYEQAAVVIGRLHRTFTCPFRLQTERHLLF
jgi:hypothetical protein